jgi:hypothetical protein
MGSNRRSLLLIFLFYSLIGGVFYANTLDNSFHYDDRYYVVENQEITHLDKFPSLFKEALFHAHYRPLVTFSYMLNYAAGGLDPWGYHVVGLFVHILTAFLVALILHHMTGRLEIGFLSGLLFLIHPFNSEAINYITARSSQLYTLFYLLAFYAYVRYHPPVSEKGETAPPSHFWIGVFFASFVLSMLSKEMAVTLPVLLFLYVWLIGSVGRWRDRLRGLWIPGMLTVGVIVSYLIIRKVLVGGVFPAGLGRDLVSQLATQSVVLIRTLGLILWPSNLTIDHRVELYENFSAWPVVGACGVLAGILWFAVRWGLSSDARIRLRAFLLIWFFVVLSPLVLMPLNAMLQENRAYLAMVGVVGLAAVGLVGIWDKVKPWGLMYRQGVWAAVAVLFVIYSGLTIQRNGVWQDDVTLWSDALRKNPFSSEAHLALGTAYHQQKKLDRAVREYQEALVIKPEDFRARGNLAQVYRQQGLYDQAIVEYLNVVRLMPEDPDAHYGLGLSYQQAGYPGLAMKEYQKTLAIRPSHNGALHRMKSLNTLK